MGDDRAEAMARLALIVGVAAAFLVGCGGAEPPIGAFGAMPQSHSIATQAVRRWSRMVPGAKGEDLLYVIGSQALYMLSYPDGKLVAKVAGEGGSGVCSDTSGNVYVTAGATIFEYAHGRTTPFTTLQDAGQSTVDCSFDTLSGNLAVTNAASRSSPGSIALYLKARGNPVIYSAPQISIYAFCGYDNKGDLFVNGENGSGAFELAELSFGRSSFHTITVNKRVGWGVLQWDGKYLTMENQPAPKGLLYRLSISGSKAMIVGTTRLASWHVHPSVLSWIRGDSMMAPDSPRARKIGFWSYPSGGLPRLVVGGFSGKDLLRGVTVSVGGRN